MEIIFVVQLSFQLQSHGFTLIFQQMTEAFRTCLDAEKRDILVTL